MRSIVRIIRLADGAGRDQASSPAGFALLDVLMASMILGMVVVGTMQFFTFGQSQITSLVGDQEAYDLARTRLEALVAAGYDDAIDQVETGLTVNDQPATRTTTVTFVDDPADSLGGADVTGTQDYKLIRVDVTYGDQTRTLRTLLAPMTGGGGG